MIYEELKKKTHSIYPALLLETLLSYDGRRKLRHGMFWIFAILCVAVLLTNLNSGSNLLSAGHMTALLQYKYIFRGCLFTIFTLWIMFYLLELMYFSYYFKESAPIDFEVGKIIFNTKEDDVTLGFLTSCGGIKIMERLGISSDEIKNFLNNRKEKIRQSDYMTPSDVDADAYISLAEYGSTLIHFDTEFRAFLLQNEITAGLFTGALGWVSDQNIEKRRRDIWWSKERLARLPSIGRDWSYGKVYLLEKYGWPIYIDDSYISLGNKWKLYLKTIENIERVLTKESGNNILLVSDHEFNAREAVSSIGRMIANGTIINALEHKRVFILDGVRLIDNMKDKAIFEQALYNVFAQSSNSGNVILVIPRMVQLAQSAAAIGSDIAEFLNYALTNSSLQVIGLVDTSGYHSTLETNTELLKHFEKIQVTDVPEERLIDVAFSEVDHLEKTHPIIFTYQSLVQTVTDVERFFSEDDPSVRIKDLLQEVIPVVFAKGRNVVLKKDIDSLVATKTGVPQGDIGELEVDILKNLEDMIHRRVIGQNEAVHSVVTALKRNRAGLGNTKKPIGSFLFLGSTGVGKTETVKALAEAYFKNENAITRFDMSEYGGEDAVSRLLGSGISAGQLSSQLRDHQYGIVLLDEFEKSTKEVHDIFLQIFDEGFATDSRGNKVNARNTIFIATSNAGSDFITESAMKGEDVSTQKSLLINHLEHEGIYRLELLNRFDDIIIFSPLGVDQLQEIAKNQMDALNKRLEIKGITVTGTESLLRYLAEQSQDIRFGGRELNRVIKDVIETQIADAILENKISSGDKVEFDPEPNNPKSVILRVANK